jgi:hypothetical protein
MKTITPVLAALLLTCANSAMAQTPPREEEPAVIINDIRIEKASLPGSKLVWTKMIADFSTTERWIDGVAFTARAILSEDGQHRVVTGNVRYANIPAGSHSAILYLSPRATARFGEPALVEFVAFHRDTEVSEKQWKNPSAGALPPDWQSLNSYSNVLVNVTRTPWIIQDFDLAPDISGN